MKITYKDEAELKAYLLDLKKKYGTDWKDWFNRLRGQGIYIFLKNGKSVMIEKLAKIMEGDLNDK